MKRSGGCKETRTPDPRLVRALLYQLSYAPTKDVPNFRLSGRVAERTGLEPATSGVTGRHSNRLNYRSTLNLH